MKITSSLVVTVVLGFLAAVRFVALSIDSLGVFENLIQVSNRGLIIKSAITLSIHSVELGKYAGPVLVLLLFLVAFLRAIIGIDLMDTSEFLSLLDPVDAGVVDDLGVSISTASSATTSVARLFNRNVLVSNIRYFVYNWLRNPYSLRNSNVVNLVVVQLHVAFGVYIFKLLSLEGLLDVGLSEESDSDVVVLLDRDGDWDLLVKVSLGVNVLSSGGGDHVGLEGDWLSFVFLLDGVNPVNVNVLLNVGRLDEFLLDSDISWNDDSSQSLFVSNHSRNIFRVKFLFDILSLQNLDIFGIVDYFRLDGGVVMDLVSWNVHISSSYLFRGFKFLNDWFSFNYLGFSFNENWV
jgi:hypothetical protein